MAGGAAPAQASATLFEERQRFLSNAFLQAVLLVLLGAIAAFGLWQVGALGPSPIVALLVPALVLGLVLVMELHVVVRPGEVEVHMRPFPRKVIPADEVAEHAPRTYRPLLEYGGWGIRLGPRGWAYNVHGARGVQLQFRGGKRILIGSQRPEELSRAITEAKATRA